MRRSPLKRKAPLAGSGGLSGGGQLRRSRLNPVSPAKSDQRREDERWSEAVLVRDRYTCQAGPDGRRELRVAEVECAGRRDPHHIWPKGLYPERRHDPENGVTLCRAHHDWVHHQSPARARKLGLKGGDHDDG